MKNEVFITINHISDFGGIHYYRVGDELTLRKDLDNPYDDEAIQVYNDQDVKCGYVANSSYSVARGTMSSGRIYDSLKDNTKCVIRFIVKESDAIIAQLK